MQKLAKGAGVEAGTIYIGQVRKTLPAVVKDKVTDKHENWAAFLKAVRDIDVEYLKDEAAELRKRKEVQQALEAHICQLETMPASPTAIICHQMTQTSIGMGGPTNNASSINPFGGGGGGQGNLFSQTGRPPTVPVRQPATPADRAAIKARIANLPHHPDTQAGRTANQGQ
jgi:hypothetical protein